MRPGSRSRKASFDHDAELLGFFDGHLKGTERGVGGDPVRYYTLGRNGGRRRIDGLPRARKAGSCTSMPPVRWEARSQMPPATAMSIGSIAPPEPAAAPAGRPCSASWLNTDPEAGAMRGYSRTHPDLSAAIWK